MSVSPKGKWAEKQASDWLTKRSTAEHGFAWHRYPDASAARGALANQPADFLVGRAWGNSRREACHLEVKETREVRRLPLAKIGQYGKLNLFHHAGFRTIVLVYRSEKRDWVYLTGLDLFGAPEVPKSFRIDDRPAFPDAQSALEEIFE